MKLALLCLCALLVVVHGRSLRERRSPEESSWTDSLKGVFEKVKGEVANTVDSLKGSDVVASVRTEMSNAYDRMNSDLQTARERLTEMGDGIQKSDAFQGMKDSLNKAAENFN